MFDNTFAANTHNASKYRNMAQITMFKGHPNKCEPGRDILNVQCRLVRGVVKIFCLF